jgi:paraquat-inducible protein A
MSDRASAMLVACHDCDEVHRVPELPDGGTAVCARCGGVLVRHRAEGIERALALNIAALSLFGVANLFPLMARRLGGQAVTTTLLKGVTALYSSGIGGLAALVLLVAILIPLLKLVGLIWILGLACRLPYLRQAPSSTSSSPAPRGTPLPCPCNWRSRSCTSSMAEAIELI